MRWIEYTEPTEDGGVATINISEQEAIRQIKIEAEKHDYHYATDEMALEDFMVVHWAYFITEPSEAAIKAMEEK